MKKVGLFEQPRIYYIYIFVILAFYLFNKLLNDEVVKTAIDTLFYLYVASLTMYLLHKSKIQINSVSGNTPQSIGIGAIMVLGLFIASTFIGILFGYASNFMTANSIAMVGAMPQYILLNSPFIMFIIIVFFIATLETMVILQLLDIIMFYSKAPYNVKDPRTITICIILGFGATIYHAYAKYIALTGQLNVHALIIVFFLFTSSCLLAVKQKEMEPSIYYHIGNNFLAMIYRLRDVLKAFGLGI